ncbi:unnamed protein product, partial [Porites evermanni]
MKFVTCILMFIRASREGDWSLHLEYLKALARKLLYNQEGEPILCNWSGPCYRTRQQVDEGSGRTQQPAAMARWFLVAPELIRLAAHVEEIVGLQRASSSHHHDLSDVLTKRCNENAQKLKDVL